MPYRLLETIVWICASVMGVAPIIDCCGARACINGMPQPGIGQQDEPELRHSIK
jgi:hypothetical protein